jgi:hypothetical protein
LELDVTALRLEFKAEDPIHFPAGKAANILRGSLGLALPAEIFAPRGEGGPSGLADRPRPFVLRVRHLDGVTVRAGEVFHVGVNVFQATAVEAIIRGFTEAGAAGFGPGRGRAVLKGCHSEQISLNLAPNCVDFDRIRVDFVTPTELKHEGHVAVSPEFPLLAARVRDRVSGLRALYGAGPLDLDFAGFGARAAAVRMTRCEIRDVAVERRSSRTGQTHPIGGFVGVAEYEGPLAEFVPFLEAARWTGVGRQAVWGKGEIAVEKLA